MSPQLVPTLPVNDAMLPARLPRDAVRRTYTWIAPVHDVLGILVEKRPRRLALEWADLQNGEAVLEVGVGTGLLFRHLLRANPDGWTEGVDRTPAMLRRASRRAAREATGRYRLRLGDAYALDLPDASFDALLCSYLFDLLPGADFPVVLGEFRRVLKPGGRLILVNMTTTRHWYEAGWQTLYRLCPLLLGGCRAVRAAPFLEQAGFHRVRRRPVSQCTFPSEVVYGEKQ